MLLKRHIRHSSLLPSRVPTVVHLAPDGTCYSRVGRRPWRKWQSTRSLPHRSDQWPPAVTPAVSPASSPLVKDTWFGDSHPRDSDSLRTLPITLETSSCLDQDNCAQVPLSPGRTFHSGLSTPAASTGSFIVLKNLLEIQAPSLLPSGFFPHHLVLT